MARILFLMRYPLDSWDNLKNKFDGQMVAVEVLGHEAWFIGFGGGRMWLCRGKERRALLRCPLASVPGYTKTVLYVDLMSAVKRAVRALRFEAVYMRFMPVFFNAPSALRSAKKAGAKLVMEQPTYPFDHGRVTSPLRRPVFRYNEHVMRKIEPMLDLYTLIGDPCGETLHGVPAMNIVNGVDAERLPLHQSRSETEEISLLALASMSRWQGYDRLIEALAAYRGEKRVTVHMVGGEGDGSLAEWKRLAQERNVADRVIFHGEMFGEKLDQLIEQCDVGVGGLGLYRKRQFTSMTLKLREYMARGLPFVYAVDDPSLPQDERFCLRLANDDSPIDMETLVRFAVQAKRSPEVPALMRAYAKAHMSWQGILKDVLERVEIL